MIGFAIPWILGAAMAAALAITALHFLSVRTPRVMLLPTARFVPERDARAVARQAKPSDVLLLLLRVIALLAAGAALAGARCGQRSGRVASIIVFDWALRADSAMMVSRAMGARSVGASTAATVADVGDASPPTVLWVHGVSNDPGVAIAAAIRESARQAQANPSLAELSLTVAMPASVRSRGGWDAWRGQWPAKIRVVHIGHIGHVAADVTASESRAASSPALGAVRIVGATSTVGSAFGADVVEAAFASRGAIDRRGSAAEAAEVLVQRASTGSSTDGADRAPVLVRWPVNGMPLGWRAAPAMDSVGAVAAAGIALVAPWVRTALPPVFSDSVRAIAWWSDGVAAAVERARGTSCVRDVAIAVAQGSDLLLSPAANGLLRAIGAPCGGGGVPAPRETANASTRPAGGSEQNSYASATRFREAGAATRATQPEWLATALLALALAALVAEHIVRRESARTTAL